MEPLCCPAEPQPSVGGEPASVPDFVLCCHLGTRQRWPSCFLLAQVSGCCQGPQLQPWARAGTCCCNCPSAHSMRPGPERPSCPAATSITCRRSGGGAHPCPCPALRLLPSSTQAQLVAGVSSRNLPRLWVPGRASVPAPSLALLQGS